MMEDLYPMGGGINTKHTPTPNRSKAKRASQDGGNHLSCPSTVPEGRMLASEFDAEAAEDRLRFRGRNQDDENIEWVTDAQDPPTRLREPQVHLARRGHTSKKGSPPTSQ